MNLGTTLSDAIGWLLAMAAVVVVLTWYIIFVQRRRK